MLPEEWSRLSYSIYWKGRKLRVEAARDSVTITSQDKGETLLKVYGREYTLKDKLIVKKEEVEYGQDR